MKKTKKIQLSEQQSKDLNALWFLYGNKGKLHTHHNHRFIQNLIEHGEDTEKFYRSAEKSLSQKAGLNWKEVSLSNDCVEAVREILNNK
jgi:hypothetical protein